MALGAGFLLIYVGFISWIGGMIVGVVVAAGLKRISGYKLGVEMEIIATRFLPNRSLPFALCAGQAVARLEHADAQ